MKQFFLSLLACGACWSGSAQTVIPLYKDSIPNARPVEDAERWETDAKGITRVQQVSRPTLTVFLPPKEKATGAGVIICPGGGYARLAFSHEGTDVAKRFAEMGVAAFVLKYRLPSDETMWNKETGPLMDAQRAIQLVRENAKEWGINKKRVGIIGFSAGGHLASTAGTHFSRNYVPGNKRTSVRPDFMILVYPVISFADSITHRGSRNNLLGQNPPAEKISEYSNELRVTKKTPPAFLIHAEDDSTVKVQNMLLFAAALQKYRVPFDFYLYEKGGHGFGMHNPTSEVKWTNLVEDWLKQRRILDR